MLTVAASLESDSATESAQYIAHVFSMFVLVSTTTVFNSEIRR